MDPVTAAGLGLAIIPLVISALQNYEYTFQPIYIFSRSYQREVERFQHALRVQKVTFENECCFLLHSVTSNCGNDMVKDLQHPLWQDSHLEERLKTRLNESYEGCRSALHLINEVLTDILRETKTLFILQQKQHVRIDRYWLKRFRQRCKISFSKDHFDRKLQELECRIEGLHKIRKHIEHPKMATDVLETSSTALVKHFCDVQKASSRLHDVLSSLWRCETQEEHSANICLETGRDLYIHCSQGVRFDLTWTCPAQIHIPEMATKFLRLSIETLRESQPNAMSTPQVESSRQTLQSALEVTLRDPTPSNGLETSRSDIPAISDVEVGAAPQDLYTVPNLCHHLGKQPIDARPIHCAGFLQKAKTSKYLIYTPHNHAFQDSTMKTLEDALKVAGSRTEGIPLLEKLMLAKSLALAVLRFHSTPWLSGEWRSQDVVFFGIKDLSHDPLRTPFLRSSVKILRTECNQQATLPQSAPHLEHPHVRPIVRNQTLYSLGMMLVELAYDSSLQDLQIPEDDQGDRYTLFWAAKRLGGRVQRMLGPGYAKAVKFCLERDDRASLDELEVQSKFFKVVVQKLEALVEAIDD